MSCAEGGKEEQEVVSFHTITDEEHEGDESEERDDDEEDSEDSLNIAEAKEIHVNTGQCTGLSVGTTINIHGGTIHLVVPHLGDARNLSFMPVVHTVNGEEDSPEDSATSTMREEEEGGDEDFSGQLLHLAALWGNAELLEDLLHGDQVHHPDVADPLGRTALHAAVTNEDETCAKVLLQAGANPNIACGPRGFNKTPLHVAAENGHVAIVRLLIDYQADLLAKESHGFTAMDLAEQCGHPQVTEVLRHAAGEEQKLVCSGKRKHQSVKYYKS